MAEQYDPSNYKVEEVNGYLADASEEEKARVLQAEADGENRKGIVEGPHAAPADDADPQGLAATGNPNDLAQKGSTPDGEAAHQEGAPPELAEAADRAEELGYLGVGVEDKPDYSQANPDVMGR